MFLRIEQGKGLKDRYAKLSEVLLEQLRSWWREGYSKGKLLKQGWLFPGQDIIRPMSARQLSRVCRQTAQRVGIKKPVSMHTFRHSFATHLLEDKVDIRVIQVLLGHKRIETTTRYVQVATNLMREVTSPIDTLDFIH
jgi:integrase/recombinase XerD